MKTTLALLATTAALGLTLGQGAMAQGHGNGNGNGHDKPGKGGGHQAQSHPGKGPKDDGPGQARGGPDRDHGPAMGRASDSDRGRGNDHDRGGGRPDRDDRAERGHAPVLAERGRGDDHGDRGPRARDENGPVRTVVLTPWRDHGLIAGCPPGLAKKNNGCLPPGQAKAIERARYDYLWRDADRRYVVRYEDGYQYRYNPQGGLLGYLPALGGVLAPGSVWPTSYAYDPIPRYQLDYYGLNGPYDYRYANGALFGVDPRTSAIQQVAALLTGQTPQVGQRMPAGYDIYNVPYAYRDRYADNANALYRYNDGAVYQLDPTTQVIQAVIQLLT